MRTWRKLAAGLLLTLPIGYWTLIVGEMYHYSRVQGWQTHFLPDTGLYLRNYLIVEGLWEPTVGFFLLAGVVFPWPARPKEETARDAVPGDSIWPPPPRQPREIETNPRHNRRRKGRRGDLQDT